MPVGDDDQLGDDTPELDDETAAADELLALEGDTDEPGDVTDQP